LGTAGAGLAVYIVECIALRRWQLVLGWSDIPFSIECVTYTTIGWLLIVLLRWGPADLPLRYASILAVTALCVCIAYRERNILHKLASHLRERLGGTGGKQLATELSARLSARG